MQTCVGSVAGMAFSGGFGSYLIAMDQQSYENVGNIVGNNPWVRFSSVILTAQDNVGHFDSRLSAATGTLLPSDWSQHGMVTYADNPRRLTCAPFHDSASGCL